MRLTPMTALLPLFLLASLTGCVGTTPKPQVITKIQIERPHLPANKLYCQSRPEPPARGKTQKAVAWYAAQLHAWGEDCEARLAEVREIVRPTVTAMEPVK